MKTANTVTLLAALTGAVLLGATCVATAGPAVGAISVVVDYHDLDMSRPDSNLTLYKRIVAAAKQVCPPEDEFDLSKLSASRACQRAAIGRAVDGISNPQLAALYSQRLHRG